MAVLGGPGRSVFLESELDPSRMGVEGPGQRADSQSSGKASGGLQGWDHLDELAKNGDLDIEIRILALDFASPVSVESALFIKWVAE